MDRSLWFWVLMQYGYQLHLFSEQNSYERYTSTTGATEEVQQSDAKANENCLDVIATGRFWLLGDEPRLTRI